MFSDDRASHATSHFKLERRMRILQFKPGCPPELADAETTGGNDRFLWLDVERSESDWHDKAQPWLGTRLHDRHVQDTLNDTHPPYYDGMDDYDLLVVRAPHPDCTPPAPETRPVAFILTGTAVVSVRPPGDPLFAKLHQRFLASKRKCPTSPVMLLYHHAVVVQQDIDALVQIYFSASAQRTNEILQFLTILSAVFLPLNLLAGLFGMNVTHLPLLAVWYGPWILVGVMLLVVSGLLLWFRRRRWL
jgi:Mg2+ and Co2+ transporter CorA